RFEEHPKAVDWQISQLPPAHWKVLEGDSELAAWEQFRARYLAMGPAVIKIVGLPNDVGTIIEMYRTSSWIAHALNGAVLLGWPSANGISAIRERFPAVIEKAPIEERRQFGTFGIRGTPRRLMEEMKRSFDPQKRLNPGRHIDGE